MVQLLYGPNKTGFYNYAVSQCIAQPFDHRTIQQFSRQNNIWISLI